jgi:hypothetical protein
MIKQLAQRRIAKSREDRYGERYNFGATYFDARDEALRRGDRTIGTEHLLLALLVDPDSPAARAVGRDLDTARRALDLLDSEALAAIGLAPGVAAGPVAPRPEIRLRLTPAAKSVFTGVPDFRKNKRAALGKLVDALLDLQPPDPAAVLLSSLGVDPFAARKAFAELDGWAQP